MMQTERILFRERTLSIQEEILKLPQEEQLSFLGYEETSDLTNELMRIKKLIVKKLDNWKKWDLIEKSSERVIGNCVYHNWFRDHERAEIGYMLHEQYRKKGLMNEAVQELIKYGFENMKLNRIEACIDPTNEDSLKLIRRLGFKQEGLLRQHYNQNGRLHDSMIFSILKSDYQ